ncbi:hypothetical protein DFJ73DRAFT_815446 [Zopfochytrium polystomum]|nr:hypothetical protein DFJ73DRAFT_815446 [Zopfochytrium polystomum]
MRMHGLVQAALGRPLVSCLCLPVFSCQPSCPISPLSCIEPQTFVEVPEKCSVSGSEHVEAGRIQVPGQVQKDQSYPLGGLPRSRSASCK